METLEQRLFWNILVFFELRDYESSSWSQLDCFRDYEKDSWSRLDRFRDYESDSWSRLDRFRDYESGSWSRLAFARPLSLERKKPH